MALLPSTVSPNCALLSPAMSTRKMGVERRSGTSSKQWGGLEAGGKEGRRPCVLVPSPPRASWRLGAHLLEGTPTPPFQLQHLHAQWLCQSLPRRISTEGKKRQGKGKARPRGSSQACVPGPDELRKNSMDVLSCHIPRVRAGCWTSRPQLQVWWVSTWTRSSWSKSFQINDCAGWRPPWTFWKLSCGCIPTGERTSATSSQ